MKKVIIAVVVMLFAVSVKAQVQGLEKNSAFMERLYFGGGLDLQFNSLYALIGASPSVGYMVTSSTSIGVGITYQYLQYRVTKESTDFYGYRFFLRQNLISQLFAYAEWENLSRANDINDPNSGRDWRSTPYLGGGWYQPINDKAGFQIIALYNLNIGRGGNLSPSPWSFRTGITYSPF